MPQTTNKDSTNTSQSTATQQSSYAPQVADLNTAFTDAMGDYNKSSTATAPTDFTASFSPEQLQSFRQMIGYGNNNAVPNAQAAGSQSLINSGTNGVSGALTGFAGYDPSASNNTSSLVDSANQYVSGQDIPSQVKLAMQHATETARDTTLPGIEQGAAGTGNTNSSRTGIAEGLVQRGLAEDSQNLEGTLRSQAFQNGLTLAQQQAQNNNTDKLAALSGQGAVGATSSSVGNAMGASSVADMIAQLSAGATGGAGLTAAQQAQLTNQLQQYQSGVQAPYAPLAGLLSLIGGNYGMTTNTTGSGTGHETDTTQASPLTVAGGILGAGTSLFGSGGFNILGSLGKGLLSSSG